MFQSFSQNLQSWSSNAAEKRHGLRIAFWMTCVLFVTAALGFMLLRGEPTLSIIYWLLYLGGAVLITYQPRYAVYLIVGLAMASDMRLDYSWPFVKNLSSPESIMFVSRAAYTSPVEIYMILALIAWFGKSLIQRKPLNVYFGELLWPGLIFAGFVAFGVVRGILSRGIPVIAVWESRPIFYIAIMLLLVSSLLTKREHVKTVFWFAFIGLFITSIRGVLYVHNDLNWMINSVERIAEHGYSIRVATLIVFLFAAFFLRASFSHRFIPLLLVLPALISFASNQRRASYVAIILSFIIVIAWIYYENRKLFYFVLPASVILGTLYLGVFWNASGALGQPARAVRSAIFPNQLSDRDSASSNYRVLENINIMYTIRTSPLLGIGFGNKFYVVVPMPSISMNFERWEYLTHNSLLWVWMKTGLGGFLAMFYLFSMSVIVGARTVWRMPPGDCRIYALTATTYIMMQLIYTYVDIAWDVQSMIYLGTMMGIINCLDRVIINEPPKPAKRWPWQPDPKPEPTLQPW
jgi:hypothetical protein